MEKLTHQEEELMLIIWQNEPGFIKDFLEKMEEPRPPYTTIASVVKNLERKGYVTSRRYGNTYEYKALIREEDYKKKFLSNVVKNYFENSYKDLVSYFAAEKKISAEELQEIIRLIEKNPQSTKV
ncbi:MAG TPA: BlaI/MecI/CopY family transcriptional regulator [Paludibacteraceae bacterium]|nr:BlaI/MecI/CopY family transcriptional regulator [Paludibacteraceae bacterium]HPT43558.1 BlaI/MecI/CopY family transcriptional regulator [Paludibacteraceae bacterium]